LTETTAKRTKKEEDKRRKGERRENTHARIVCSQRIRKTKKSKGVFGGSGGEEGVWVRRYNSNNTLERKIEKQERSEQQVKQRS